MRKRSWRESEVPRVKAAPGSWEVMNQFQGSWGGHWCNLRVISHRHETAEGGWGKIFTSEQTFQTPPDLKNWICRWKTKTTPTTEATRGAQMWRWCDLWDGPQLLARKSCGLEPGHLLTRTRTPSGLKLLLDQNYRRLNIPTQGRFLVFLAAFLFSSAHSVPLDHKFHFLCIVFSSNCVLLLIMGGLYNGWCQSQRSKRAAYGSESHDRRPEQPDWQVLSCSCQSSLKKTIS